MCIEITCLPVYGVINFETNLSFLYQVVFLHDQKSQDQNSNILRLKKFLLRNKIFFIIFKGLSVTGNCVRSEGGPKI